jgi:alpha-aminoadipate/glutamate carrier protein LysW
MLDGKDKAVAYKCPDCDIDLKIPSDYTVGNILSCHGCGLELEIKEKNGVKYLEELTLEGEDWGE